MYNYLPLSTSEGKRPSFSHAIPCHSLILTTLDSVGAKSAAAATAVAHRPDSPHPTRGRLALASGKLVFVRESEGNAQVQSASGMHNLFQKRISANLTVDNCVTSPGRDHRGTNASHGDHPDGKSSTVDAQVDCPSEERDDHLDMNPECADIDQQRTCHRDHPDGRLSATDVHVDCPCEEHDDRVDTNMECADIDQQCTCHRDHPDGSLSAADVHVDCPCDDRDDRLDTNMECTEIDLQYTGCHDRPGGSSSAVDTCPCKEHDDHLDTNMVCADFDQWCTSSCDQQHAEQGHGVHSSDAETQPAVGVPNCSVNIPEYLYSSLHDGHNLSLSKQNHTHTHPSPVPAVDNPYGSDLTATPPCLGDDDNDDEEAAELDREFSWSDDSVPPDATDPTGNTSSQGPPRSSMPTWLKNDYHQVQERLTKEMKHNSLHMPTCYERCSFYDGPENHFLAARKSYDGSAAGIFHQCRYFVWLPHLLVDHIPCPACLEAKRQGLRTHVVYLQSNGFVDSPRCAVDIKENVYIIGYRYRCAHKDCHKTYQSWSLPILAALPRAVSDQFSFRLTYCNGLTGRLAGLLREMSRGGVSPRVFTTIVQALHYHRFDQLQCQFLEMASARLAGSLQDCWSSNRPFGEFGNRDGYAGYIPSQGYFGCFYDMMVEAEAPELQQIISSRPANVLKHDHSFKVSVVSVIWVLEKI